VPTSYNKNRPVPIDYTSRDFNSIKADLINYTKRYYPETFQDFSEASFGSLMLDTVAYVGDVLSYYLDYQVNESFLDTAIEYQNVLKLSKQLGYRYKGIPISTGLVTFYILVPSATDGVYADLNYAPILERGTKFSTDAGTVFTLADNVNFANSANEMVVATVDSSTGVPTKYAIKAYGRVISGEVAIQTLNAGDYQRYPRFELDGENIVEVVSVTDSQGNRYYEVDYLAQDTIYKPVLNSGADKNQVPYILKPMSVPRRFIVDSGPGGFFIQFGHGSEQNLTNQIIADPSSVVLQAHGRDYIKDKSFDPTKLIETDHLGVAPSNTVLTVIYRVNGPSNVNVASKAITKAVDTSFRFRDPSSLDSSTISEVQNSLEFENEAPIVGSTRTDSASDIKTKAYGMFSSQNRAVTRQDYLSLIYNMPPEFGSVKRAAVFQDENSFKRNLNIYVASEDNSGGLSKTNASIKNNLKTWISNYKMLNDTVDILDAVVVNVGIKFEVLGDQNINKYKVLQRATSAIAREFAQNKFSIGESLSLGKALKALRTVDGILDVTTISFIPRTGSQYSSASLNLKTYLSRDRRTLHAPKNVVFEVRYPNIDIIGSVT
jgi:hypothetical protein